MYSINNLYVFATNPEGGGGGEEEATLCWEGAKIESMLPYYVALTACYRIEAIVDF